MRNKDAMFGVANASVVWWVFSQRCLLFNVFWFTQTREKVGVTNYNANKQIWKYNSFFDLRLTIHESSTWNTPPDCRLRSLLVLCYGTLHRESIWKYSFRISQIFPVFLNSVYIMFNAIRFLGAHNRTLSHSTATRFAARRPFISYPP